VLAKGYTGKEIEKLFVQKLLEYGISINSKNNQGMTPLHVHLENWDFHKPRNTVNRRLDERFHERFEMPLLKIFQRYACSDLLHSLSETCIQPFKSS
jgi:hypothetical protein